MATSSDPTILALIAIVGTVITALFKLLNDNTKALKDMADSSTKIAVATEIGNAEAKQRNGHLGEQNVQIAQLVTNQNLDIAAIKESSRASAETNVRVEKILTESAKTLMKTETRKTKAAKKVEDTLENK